MSVFIVLARALVQEAACSMTAPSGLPVVTDVKMTWAAWEGIAILSVLFSCLAEQSTGPAPTSRMHDSRDGQGRD
jgi:hypothetical protein